MEMSQIRESLLLENEDSRVGFSRVKLTFNPVPAKKLIFRGAHQILREK
jgi:hypothetical protein